MCDGHDQQAEKRQVTGKEKDEMCYIDEIVERVRTSTWTYVRLLYLVVRDSPTLRIITPTIQRVYNVDDPLIHLHRF